MNRLENYTLYTKSITNTKINIYQISLNNKFKSIILSAGLYKPNLITMQHSLIFSSLTGKPPITNYQIHGKRMRRTVSLNVSLNKQYIFPVLSKLVYEIIPILLDFKTPKWHKNNIAHSYTLRIRQKFTYYDEFDDLISNQMYDSYKGIFLPLNINLNFNNSTSHINNEIFLRLIHLPVIMFKRRARPAFDDSVKFE